MKMTDNEQAKNTLDNLIGSIKNRFSEVYNLGYKDGYENGTRDAVNEVVKYAKGRGEKPKFTGPNSISTVQGKIYCDRNYCYTYGSCEECPAHD